MKSLVYYYGRRKKSFQPELYSPDKAWPSISAKLLIITLQKAKLKFYFLMMKLHRIILTIFAHFSIEDE